MEPQFGSMPLSSEHHQRLPELFDSWLPVESGPFALASIAAAGAQMHHQVELATMRAALKARELATIELFCLLAQNAPEALPPTWAGVYDLLCAEERFWVYPKVTLAEIEDGLADGFTPYLNRQRVGAEWEDLLSHACTMISAQKSAKDTGLPA